MCSHRCLLHSHHFGTMRNIPTPQNRLYASNSFYVIPINQSSQYRSLVTGEVVRTGRIFHWPYQNHPSWYFLSHTLHNYRTTAACNKSFEIKLECFWTLEKLDHACTWEMLPELWAYLENMWACITTHLHGLLSSRSYIWGCGCFPSILCFFLFLVQVHLSHVL